MAGQPSRASAARDPSCALELVSLGDTAGELGVTRRRVYDLIAARKLDAYYVPGPRGRGGGPVSVLHVTRPSLDALLAERAKVTPWEPR